MSMQKNYSQHYAARNFSVSAFREGLIMQPKHVAVNKINEIYCV